MKSFRVRKNDKVMVCTGKDVGKIGKILRILKKKNAVIVEKLNMAKRHTKKNQYSNNESGIVEKEMPIDVSNVMVVCGVCGKPTRVGYRYVESGGEKKKVRFCKKCNEAME
ncbi:MAG: 50S ribosomal protein L24 [Desulfovibrionaceae bacterium]|nr:50S ribosomal protein L24 [Desulfovibrionaceae bacterium]